MTYSLNNKIYGHKANANNKSCVTDFSQMHSDRNHPAHDYMYTLDQNIYNASQLSVNCASSKIFLH